MTEPIENKQLVCQFYPQLSTMPAKKAATGQLPFARTPQSKENLKSRKGWVSPIPTQRVSLLQEDQIYDISILDSGQDVANMDDDLSNGLGDNQSELKPTTQSKIASMPMIMEEHREMFQ